DGQQPERPGAHDRHLGRLDLAGGVDRAGGGLDEHGLLVGDVVGDLDDLGRVDDHLLGPAAAGGLAVAALQPGLEIAEGDPLAQVDATGPAHGARRADAPGGAVQHGDDDDPATVLEVAHDLVAGRERERDDRLEPAGRPAVDGGEVAAADAQIGRASCRERGKGGGDAGTVE